MSNYIPLNECIDRGIYRIHSRNLSVGVFRESTKGFIGIRYKFGDEYLFEEYHYDNGPPYGTVDPKEQIGVLPDEILNNEFVINEFGTRNFAIDPSTGSERCVIRRDLLTNETQHGERIGFVDEWADTKQRLPDDVWPYIKENEKLLNYLKINFTSCKTI